jgi:5'-3' exonuclease
MVQDGDLIMSGWTKQKPNLVLLQEQVVVFKMTKQKLATTLSENGLDAFLHHRFELLHIPIFTSA